MRQKGRKARGILAGVIFLGGSILALAETKRVSGTAALDASLGDKVLHYIRARYMIPENVKLSIDPFRNSLLPGFYEATVTVDDGKRKNAQVLYLSKNNRYLVVGNAMPLGSDAAPQIMSYVREAFKLPATAQIAVGSFKASSYPNFLETVITLDDGKRKQAQTAYVTADKRYVVLGNIFLLMSEREVMSRISLANQASLGPAKAPVTIVEYADLQCSTCQRMQVFLETDLLPKYGDKVRVVFKEFPLVSMHEWALTAAIASQCAYQINPSAFVLYRSLIFQHQSGISAANVRDALVIYGQQAGLDRLELAACIDSKASLPRVEENLHEGQALNVISTPTFFINGRILVGGTSPPDFYKVVDEVLRDSK